MQKRNNIDINCNRDIHDPSTTYVPSDKIITIIVTIMMTMIFICLCFFLFRDGVDSFFSNSILNIVLVLSAVVVTFLLIVFGFSKTFPIYINEFGTSYRTFFFRKKNLKWEDVADILVYRQSEGYSNKILYSLNIIGKKGLGLSLAIHIKEKDDYQELLKLLDYYVKKHSIKIRFNDSIFHFKAELTEIPKKLDFSK